MSVAPQIINNPDGTIELKGNTLQKYIIDQTRKFQIVTACNQSNASWDGKNQNGSITWKGSIIEVRIMLNALPSTLTTVSTYTIIKDTDLLFIWDDSKLEFLDSTTGFAFDPAVFDASKLSATVIAPGVGRFHSQVLPAPHLRTPPTSPLHYQWNLGGYLLQGGGRVLGTLRFRVKSDFYFPVEQTTDIRIVASANGETSKVNGDPALLSEIRNNANKILFGPTPEYKVSHELASPETSIIKGQEFGVKIFATPETLPQVIWSVSTIFGWDPTVIEFMGVDKTGAKPSMQSAIYMPGTGSINESAIPKDGNAHHVWMSVLGDKKPISAKTLIATLKFKALTDFTETTVELLEKNDPRFAGLIIMDDAGILGSRLGGTRVTGVRKNAVIKGLA